MLKQEFEAISLMKVSDEEYKAIEEVYMNSSFIDKVEFCDDYKKHGDSILLKQFYEKSVKNFEKVVKLEKEMDVMVNFIIEQAEKCSSMDLRDKAIEMIGEAKYLQKKLERGFNLWQVDKDLMITILSEVRG